MSYNITQIHFFLYKQPVYKQLGLDLQKVKQLLGLKHVIISNFANKTFAYENIATTLHNHILYTANVNQNIVQNGCHSFVWFHKIRPPISVPWWDPSWWKKKGKKRSLKSSTNRVFHLRYYIIIQNTIYLQWSTGSWDIKIWKIEQSNWPRAFQSVIREPDFSQHLCIPLAVLYHHTKYYLKLSNGSWDIKILKIEQSNWPRAFRSVTGEPDFSQHLCIPLAVLYHHTKYYLKWSTGSWDVQIWKIEQSNWPRAFWSVTWEPYFPQTWSFQRMIENHHMFDFRTLGTNISRLNVLLKCKNPIFGPFGPFCPKLAKPELAPSLFHPYWHLTSCKILWFNSKKKPDGRKDRRKDGRTDRRHWIHKTSLSWVQKTTNKFKQSLSNFEPWNGQYFKQLWWLGPYRSCLY